VVLGTVLASTLFLVGCGKGVSQVAQDDTVKVELESAENSGVSGTAAFLTTPGGVEVKLDVVDLPKPDTIYLAHIHSGSCGEEVYEHGEEQGTAHEHEGGEIEYPLSPVKSDSEGSASSTTTLWDTTTAKLFSSEPKYVNVHASGQGSPPPLACANLGR
jgi:hypothetical protein